jgi:hypothetical protein
VKLQFCQACKIITSGVDDHQHHSVPLVASSPAAASGPSAIGGQRRYRDSTAQDDWNGLSRIWLKLYIVIQLRRRPHNE